MNDPRSDTGGNKDEAGVDDMRRPLFRHKLVRLALYGISALGMLAAASVKIIPAARDWRARHLAEASEELRRQGKLEEAADKAENALQVRPDFPEALRARARAMFASGNTNGLQVMQKLADGGADAGDQLELAEAALRFGDLQRAESAATRLAQHKRHKAAALNALARVRMAQQRTQEAVTSLRESLAAGGGAPSALLLARLQIAEGTPASLAEAVNLLRAISVRPDRDGLKSLLVLVSLSAAGVEEAEGWINALKHHPLAGAAEQLAAASARIRVHPESRAAVIAETIRQYGGAPVEQRAELARWLNANGEFGAALEAIRPEEAARSGDLFLLRLDAMAGRGQWEEIGRLLQGEGLPLNNAMILLYRGRAAAQSGKTQEASALYRRSVMGAAPTPDVMWNVIAYLQRLGEERILEQELSRLAENPAFARRAFAALVPIVQKRRNADELYRLYDHMLARLPSDTAIQNDHRYLAALTGKSADAAGARDLLAREPRMLAYRITLALALLKGGQSAAALEVFDSATIDATRIQPNQRAVLAAVLGTNGRTVEARQLAGSINAEDLTTAEFALIATWRVE